MNISVDHNKSLKSNIKSEKAFTLIELLLVISIMALIIVIALPNIKSSIAKTHDVKRLNDMAQIQKALELYYDENGRYPSSDYDGNGGWDVGNADYQLLTNKLDDFMKEVPNDIWQTGTYNGYRYFRYSAGSYGCDSSKGAFYVLGIGDMETSARPYSDSPGWSCPSRNWQNEFDWVVGKFENE